MGEAGHGEVTELLLAWSGGETTALDKVMPPVYAELHRLARRYMSRDKRRLGPGRPHVFAPNGKPRPSLPPSRRAQEARIMAISDGFRWAVNRVNSFP